MRKSKTLAKLRAGKPVRMCVMGHFIPPFVHMAARAEYDCIWLDLEHRLIPEQQLQALLTHFHLADIDCMLRPSTLEKSRLYRYLEDGAAGLMIPHVSTAEKAEMLVQSVKFPPLGDRGLDGAGLDTRYTIMDAKEYAEAANRETFLVVQIETPEAIENVEAIAAVEGVDGLFVGPGDLGLRLRTYPNLPSLDECIERAAAAAKRHGKAWGLPAGTPEALQKYTAMGAQLLAHGSDFGAIMGTIEASARNLDEALG